MLNCYIVFQLNNSAIKRLNDMFIKAGSLFSSLTRRSKVSGAINALLVRQAFDEVLEKECGDLPAEILEVTKAISYKSGILTVKTTRLAAAELSMRSGGLVKRVNEVLGRNVVKRLSFKKVL